MTRKCQLIIASLIMMGIIRVDLALGGDRAFGIGFNAGLSRLEGDLRNPRLSPLVSGHIRVLPTPYFGIDGELGYSALRAKNHSNPQFADFKTIAIPFEISAIFNFLPFRKVNPFVFLGGGGVYWNATSNGSTIVVDGKEQDGLDSFLKTGGGLEFRLSRSFALNLGASFRYSLTDALDVIFSGDENDQVIDVHGGFTFYFSGSSNDRDGDRIPDELDLMAEIPEDRDGYLDHDGIPEKNPTRILSDGDGPLTANGSDLSSPIVIHHLITEAVAGRTVPIKAAVFSNIDLRAVAILYRPMQTPNWNVAPMEEMAGNQYQGEIPGYAVTTDGLEYCVVAVDHTLSGIGYSGLPSKPINVNVAPPGRTWRILGGSLGAAALGTASYLILRKQQ